MEIVKGQTARRKTSTILHEGKIDVYQISKAKLRVFRDGGTALGRMNDWAYTSFACGTSFFVTFLTTDNIVVKYIFVLLSFVIFVISAFLFYYKTTKKKELSAFYDEVISGEI